METWFGAVVTVSTSWHSYWTTFSQNIYVNIRVTITQLFEWHERHLLYVPWGRLIQLHWHCIVNSGLILVTLWCKICSTASRRCTWLPRRTTLKSFEFCSPTTPDRICKLTYARLSLRFHTIIIPHLTHFYRATLRQYDICCRLVSVYMSVCHESSVIYWNGIPQTPRLLLRDAAQ